MAQELIDKIPPQSNEAEMAVLGSMLLDREAISQAIELVDEGCFYRDGHKRIFSAIIKLYDANRAVDIVTLMEELKKGGSLDEVGGPSYIAQLT